MILIGRIAKQNYHSFEMKAGSESGSESALEVTVEKQSLNTMQKFGMIDTEKVPRTNGTIIECS